MADLDRIEAALARVEDKLDARLNKLDDRQDAHEREDSKQFTQMKVMLVGLICVVASPKVGGPDPGALAAQVLATFRA